ncbi:MAG: hypothetical protein ACK5LP_07275 [Campylobacteraceae bacterium]
MRKLFLLSFIVFIFIGCANKNDLHVNNPIVSTPKLDEIKTTYRDANNEIIGGVVTKIALLEDSIWSIEIKKIGDIDVEYITFQAKDIRNLEIKDNIVATIRGNMATNINFLDKTILEVKQPIIPITKDSKKIEKEVFNKRTKERQTPWIELPKDEIINLN